MSIRKALIICGATASGKSARAIEVAQTQNGVIINCDSMQVYRELEIITARPSEQDYEKAEHLLYGFMPANQACSAAKWLKYAVPEIDAAFDRGKLPIITGGTGLYIKALTDGLSPIPEIPEEYRLKATALWQDLAGEALQEIDPIMAEKLKPTDKQRITRALEVKLATGESLDFWQKQPRIKPYNDVEFTIEFINIDRGELYDRCNKRFLAMLAAGAIEEVQNLYNLGLAPNLPIMSAVGVRELFAYIAGELSLEHAIEKASQATRNYAKRQITWFRNSLSNTA